MSLSIPTIRTVRTQARVKLDGRWRYLGPAGSVHAQQQYERLIGEWLANGRRLPDAPEPAQADPSELTCEDLVTLYTDYARSYYAKGSRVTSSYARLRCSLTLWLRSGVQHLPAHDVGPRDLKDFALWLAANPDRRWARETINEYTADVRRMYQWAAEEQVLPDGAWRDIQRVKGLRKGRAPSAMIVIPREGKRRGPVDAHTVEETLAHASPVIAAMVRLQLASGMRPGEVCALRPRHIQPTSTEGVMAYHVPAIANKTEHHEIDRVVMLGPRSMEILRPWLAATPSPDDAVFRPADAREHADTLRSQRRTTPQYASHSHEAREARRRARGVQPLAVGECYTTSTYAQAIERACARAWPHPSIKIPQDPAEAYELKLWHQKHRWTPNQLRHAAATRIAEEASLEVARQLLGHASIQTTLIYAKVPERRAAAAALSVS